MLSSLPRNVVRDPIHGYIWFSEEERKIIDSPHVQRLRMIKQTPGVSFVYPGAQHSRFSHSLGVMHVAGLYALSALLNEYESHNGVYEIVKRVLAVRNWDEFLDLRQKFEVLRDIFDDVQKVRIAGLLHDLGHGPFSHNYEMAVLSEERLTHEDLTKKLIFEMKEYLENFSPNEIVKVLCYSFPGWERIRDVFMEILRKGGLEESKITEIINEYDRDFPRKCFLGAIIGGPWDADTIDFIARDGYFAGVKEYSMFDIKRLILSMRKYRYDIIPHERACYTIVAFIEARIHMFEAVYYHRTARAADRMLGCILYYLKRSDTYKDILNFDLRDLTATYLPLTDHFIDALLEQEVRRYNIKYSIERLREKRAKIRDENLYKALLFFIRLRNRDLLKVAWPLTYELPAEISLSPKEMVIPTLKEKIRQKTLKKLKLKHEPDDLLIIIDSPEFVPIKRVPYRYTEMGPELKLLTNCGELIPLKKVSPIAERIVEMSYRQFVRVYTFKEYRKSVYEATEEVFKSTRREVSV